MSATHLVSHSLILSSCNAHLLTKSFTTADFKQLLCQWHRITSRFCCIVLCIYCIGAISMEKAKTASMS